MLKRFLLSLSTLALANLTSFAQASSSLELYGEQPLKGWHWRFENYEAHQDLFAGQGVLSKGDVSAAFVDKSTNEKAVAFSWHDAWRAALSLEGGAPLNLNAYLPQGVVSLDLKVDELAKGGLFFKMQCGSFDCDRQVPYTLPARALQGKGWQHLQVPLSCFPRAGDAFNQVNTPFALEAGGAGRVEVANVRWLKKPEKDLALVSCPDYKTVSVTPDMLNEWWSIDWWLPRHEQKLKDIKAGPIDLVFIGDSITQGWEQSGVPVWEKYYGKRNAIALGFGGDRTENVLWRLQHGEVDGISPKLVVMMIGTNNTGHRHEDPVTTAKGIHKLLDELKTRLPNTKILLVGIFPRDHVPGTLLRNINDGVNKIIATYADNKRVFYTDIGAKFLDAQGQLSTDIMPDLLHPNAQGYEIWASAIEPQVEQLLGE